MARMKLITKPGRYKMTDFVFSDEMIAELQRQWDLETKFREAKTIQERWGILREIYKDLEPEIIEAGKEGSYGLIDPYPVDWVRHFTPIEYDAWFSIRSKGLGLYPQYPVFNYFLDFAHPYLKVAVEMDGAQFHDIEKDKARDAKLGEHGWRVFRIPGRECYTPFRHIGDILEDEYLREGEKDEQIENYFLNSSDGIFEAVKIVYFAYHRRYRQEYYDLSVKTLKKHSLQNISIIGGYF